MSEAEKTAVRRRPLGITVLGDFLLSEGISAVLENIRRAGATAVACNPTVTAAANEGTGSFQPPIDRGSSPRVFDRLLFGKPSLWVRSGVSYRPHASFYRNSLYGPRKPNDLTEAHGAIVAEFIDAAVRDGLKVYLQIGAAQPTGLRNEDRPRLPDGRVSGERMADTGSLASEAIRGYNRAYTRDLLTAYPQVHGLRIDWPEYPCYTFDEVFHDFNPAIGRWAEQRDIDFAAVQKSVAELFRRLQSRLTNAHLKTIVDADRPEDGARDVIEQLGVSVADITAWLRLKSLLSTDLIADWRAALDECGPGRELIAHAFMPPYTTLTGFDFAAAAEIADVVSPKFYTMHWSLMIQFWGEVLLESNPGLDERLLVQSLVKLTDIADGDGGERLADYGYPRPDEPHPIPDAPQRRKIAQACREIDGRAMLCAMAHGYGPLDDFRRRLQLVADSETDAVWINRYGYLSDAKLDAIAAIWK